jgi:serine/threonine-protein kinase
MGIVYRAVHTVFDEVVAIKAIFPELTVDPEMRERFLNEAKIQRRLQHPNIVQIREFLIDQGKSYIVMEFVAGETLSQRLRQLGRPMRAYEAIEIFRQALEGLGFAHSQGVIHRDIKPSNIMLTHEGVAKLTDFGIARALGGANLTRTGTVRGTPAYMSPEQILGKTLDFRTDIYSMGVMLYEMLAGRVPFLSPADSESEFAVITAHVNETPTPPSRWVPDISPVLEAAILKALRKPPKERFQSCQEFQAAIASAAVPVERTVLVAMEPKPESAINPPLRAGLPPLPLPFPVGAKPPTPKPASAPAQAVATPKSSRFGPLSVVAAVAVLMALAMIAVPRRRTEPPASSPYTASTAETATTVQPEAPAPAPDTSQRQPYSPNPSPDVGQVTTPAPVETPAPVATPRARGTAVPLPPVTPQPEIRQHTQRAAEYLRNRQYADAESEYRAALQLDPQNSDLHVSLGMTLGLQGNFEGQAAEDREALRLNPNNDHAHQALGSALSRQNDREGAMAEYREAIRLNPANEGAHLSLGIQYSQMRDWDGAIAEYSEVVRLRPNNYSVHYSLGLAYEHKGDRQAALQEYRTAYEMNPNIPTYKQAYDRLSAQ